MSYGVRLGIRVNRPDLLERVRPLLPPGARPLEGALVERLYSLRGADPAPRPGLRPMHLLYAGAAPLGRSANLEVVLAALGMDLQLWVAESAPRRVFVHAGVVGWKGQALLLPGKTHTGKSTLVAALVAAGAEYYSDEYAVLDATGRVHPYARPLVLRARADGSMPVAPPVPRPGESALPPLPVGLIAALQFRDGGSWRSRTLTPGQAVLELLANTVPARRRPERVLSTLRAAAARVSALRSTRGEAEETTFRLLAELERRSSGRESAAIASTLRGRSGPARDGGERAHAGAR